MFRRRGENLHSIYIFLFLNIAFFFLEHQDAGRFGMLFGFDRLSVRAGQWWRILTYQFAQAGQGWALGAQRTVLFASMISACVRGGTEVRCRLPRTQALSFNLPSSYVSACLAARCSLNAEWRFFSGFQGYLCPSLPLNATA